MKFFITFFIGALAFSSLAGAVEKIEQKPKTMEIRTERAIKKTREMSKKAAHRIEEAACMKGDFECEKRREQNRMQERKMEQETKSEKQ